MISIIRADGKAEFAQLETMRARASEVNADIEEVVRHIMDNVKEKGYEAVKEYSYVYDRREPFELEASVLDDACAKCSPAVIAALEHAAANIRDYNQRVLARTEMWTSPDGGQVGRIVRGLTRVGVYVPGGTAAYPSSVLMNVIPAKVAGVEEVIMVTPPTEHLSTEVLAAAKIAGVDRVIAVGGAQAVAALTYGAGFIPRVDKLVGPGNAYVAAAKRLAYGTLDIDMVAGPSEVLVIADAAADPRFVAADLLAQAEHDRLASAVLVTDSETLAEAVDAELSRQLGRLSRSEIIRASLTDFGCAIVCRNLESCMEIANLIAPEHLEIMTEDPKSLLPLVKNAGAVFLGAWSPEPLGDYMAGPDHVLPTSGTARFFSPLSVDAFLKTMSVVDFGRDTLRPLAGEIITLAEAEKLTAHANSIRVRFTPGAEQDEQRRQARISQLQAAIDKCAAEVSTLEEQLKAIRSEEARLPEGALAWNEKLSSMSGDFGREEVQYSWALHSFTLVLYAGEEKGGAYEKRTELSQEDAFDMLAGDALNRAKEIRELEQAAGSAGSGREQELKEKGSIIRRRLYGELAPELTALRKKLEELKMGRTENA